MFIVDKQNNKKQRLIERKTKASPLYVEQEPMRQRKGTIFHLQLHDIKCERYRLWPLRGEWSVQGNKRGVEMQDEKVNIARETFKPDSRGHKFFVLR